MTLEPSQLNRNSANFHVSQKAFDLDLTLIQKTVGQADGLALTYISNAKFNRGKNVDNAHTLGKITDLSTAISERFLKMQSRR